jgi:protein-L-isoaspartate(D-aspartate) O-methyltransferase
MHDDRLYQRQRADLVDELRLKGIRDERVLAALGTVPRHLFVEPALRNRAYRDEALPIGLKQTISQPFTVAYQTSLLDVQPGDRLLEIGTGSGYQAAVLSELGARVFSIERHRSLLERTDKILKELGYHIVTRHGDGTRGWPAAAPFDGIIVTAAAAEVPEALKEQLRCPEPGKRGGRLVIPVGHARGQIMTLLTRLGPDTFDVEETHTFRFVPLVSERG